MGKIFYLLFVCGAMALSSYVTAYYAGASNIPAASGAPQTSVDKLVPEEFSAVVESGGSGASVSSHSFGSPGSSYNSVYRAAVLGAFNNFSKALDDVAMCVEKEIIGNTVSRGGAGNKTTVEKDNIGRTIIKDNAGNKTTIERDNIGRTIIKDNAGNKTTIERDNIGRTIIKDNAGNKTTIERDNIGRTIIKDGRGNKMTLKKDMFGKLVIETSGNIDIDKDVLNAIIAQYW